MTHTTQWPAPATLGMAVADVDTPALIVDLDALDANLARMAAYARERGMRLRTHAKMHKCSALARRQVELGAVGVCCQKASEAEVMVAGGINDVLISNEVVGAAKLARVAALAQRARIGVCVDSAAVARDLSAAAVQAGTTVDVYVEIDVGARRCGVVPGQDALALARAIAELPGLHLMGLQAYHGSAQHLRSAAERRAAIAEATRLAKLSRDLLLSAGLPCPVVTGAGTGTFELEGESGVYNELQPGSYAFMDADYGRNQTAQPFAHGLFILATVMSRAPAHAVLDVGLKTHSVDSGMPLVHADADGRPLAGLEYRKASDEHGVVFAADGVALPELGAKLRLIPGHIDPTVNLHDWLVGVRDGRVAELWPVDARGAMW
ncbi:MAG TPA: DSD1 family PLP-dependent enzyme [Burkholderiales bacterium]|jgi:D-serine deaminase-like pyridoxal phosphate-dependent protein